MKTATIIWTGGILLIAGAFVENGYDIGKTILVAAIVLLIGGIWKGLME